MCLHVKKYKKVENINAQNDDYETTSKNWPGQKKTNFVLCFLNVFKFQENKFKIVQKNF